MLHGADAAAAGDADHDGQADLPERAEPHLRELAHDLIYGGEHEPVELDLAHGAVAAQCEPYRGPDDAGLGERGIHHPAVAEILLQSVGYAEHAAELAHVLAHDEHLGVALERPAQSFVDRLGQGQRAHRAAPFVSSSTNES